MEQNQDTLSGKTSPEHSPRTKGTTSEQSCKQSAHSKTEKKCLFLDLQSGKTQERSWVTVTQSPGECLTRNIGASPKDVIVSFLSQILLRIVPAKYFLSRKACLGILNRASSRGKKLPKLLEKALKQQAEYSAKARSIGHENEKSPTIRAGTVPAAVYENHSQDTRYTELTDTAPTVSAIYGTGGNNQPLVVEAPSCFDVRFTSEGTRNARQNVYETTTSRTIDTGGNSPDSNQGGVAVVSIQGSVIGRTENNGPQGSGLGENVSFTLNTIDRHAVAFSQDAYDKYIQNEKCGSLRASGGTYGGGSETLICSTSKGSYRTEAEENLANTLIASDCKDPSIVNDLVDRKYVVRRLTPTECARLQGFPDWWCSDLAVENPSEEEMAFWRTVFETRRAITGVASKPKTDKQIKKWLSDPYSDSAEYKMWGNGVALPCVCFVIAGIVHYTQ